MKRKKNKSAIAMSVAVLTLVLMSTACTNNNPEATSTPIPTITQSPSIAPETEGTTPAVQEGTGIYEGQIDNHSIEITTDAGPTAFQISPEIGEKVSSWEPNTEVKYEYTVEIIDSNGEKLQQPTIVTIDKK